jgi:hypothetical protein
MNSIDPVLLMVAIGAGAVVLTVAVAAIHQHLEAKRDRIADAQRKRDLFKRFPDRH